MVGADDAVDAACDVWLAARGVLAQALATGPGLLLSPTCPLDKTRSSRHGKNC